MKDFLTGLGVGVSASKEDARFDLNSEKSSDICMSVLIAINSGSIIDKVSFFSEDKRFVASSNPNNISTISFNSVVSLSRKRKRNDQITISSNISFIFIIFFIKVNKTVLTCLLGRRYAVGYIMFK
ncbi:hypothetical protein BpHYR1_001534 [Brachionus plicatilis]|uniref:Uncharacterized protein n=1 Tax=Brachionus plicatilis TaxID=10195 RepID=A0A3M7Q0X7_BRAPC|nr:hypothetical protein BpHYR1_001534 [Brachionus plicatilis]